MVVKRIEITDTMRQAIEALADAQRAWRSGAVSYSAVELPKLALADAVIAAVADRRTRLPRRAVTAVIDCELRPKRRIRA